MSSNKRAKFDPEENKESKIVCFTNWLKENGVDLSNVKLVTGKNGTVDSLNYSVIAAKNLKA
eukprot:Pgem_evm1s16486